MNLIMNKNMITKINLKYIHNININTNISMNLIMNKNMKTKMNLKYIHNNININTNISMIERNKLKTLKKYLKIHQEAGLIFSPCIF